MPIATPSPCSSCFVAGGRFERVAERVAVVEDRPQAGLFALVLLDDVGLQPAAALDDVRQHGRVAGVDRRRRSLRDTRRTRRPESRRISRLRPGRRGTRGRAASASTSTSISTPRGCQNAPTMFLPPGRLMPTLPPTELSTCASSVVGTCTNRSPRANVAATNPARSPTTPPPSATTTDLRSAPSSSICSHSSAATSGDLLCSPASTTRMSTSQPSFDERLGHRLGVQLVDVRVGDDHRVRIILLGVAELRRLAQDCRCRSRCRSCADQD